MKTTLLSQGKYFKGVDTTDLLTISILIVNCYRLVTSLEEGEVQSPGRKSYILILSFVPGLFHSCPASALGNRN